MKFSSISIKNFKSIRYLNMTDIDRALILVGKNNTGKTVVLEAILAVCGLYEVQSSDFNENDSNIEIGIELDIDIEDLSMLHQNGAVSKYKNYDCWYQEFLDQLPSFKNNKLSFTYIINKFGTKKYSDGITKHNKFIFNILPKIHYINNMRELQEIQEDIFLFQGQEVLTDVLEDKCIFDKIKRCNKCFQCIGLIFKKQPDELNIFETTRLLEYKLYHLNINNFVEKVNFYFHRNSGSSQDIKYTVNFKIDKIFQMDAHVFNKDRETSRSIHTLSAGTKSIYIFSLLEAYIEEANRIPSIILIEDPEIYLHPQLQKVASEILYRLSKKNQVIFSTHSPSMLFNFSTKQIKQVVLDENSYTVINENADIDYILDDLGYTANDLMNVSFVFIVEGKQDSARLPLLLEKYYSEVYDEHGLLKRVSIIPTNSCTNIKTYANLKYINKLYLKDQFLMIRDSDGKNPNYLVKQLCSYYCARAKEDSENVPRVEPRNVLVLKYYSFENYFLDPSVMAKIGVIKKEDDFFNILYTKYKSYLYKLPSMKRMIKITGARIKGKEDLKEHIEQIKIYVRGHNLYNIFYGKYKGDKENEILKKYIDTAPKETFSDILHAIDSFIYFDSKKTEILN